MRRPVRLAAWTLVALVAIVVLTGPWIAFPALGAFLVKAGPPRHADAAVVLAGDGTGARILQAAQLAREGWVHKVFVSGPELYDSDESQLAIALAEHRGYPASLFQGVRMRGFSTREEIGILLPALRAAGVRSLLVVTSTYHTRRAAFLFHRLAPDIDVAAVAAPDQFFTPDGWWRNREGRKIFLLEWTKTAADWVGGL